MSRWSDDRWEQTADGEYVRRQRPPIGDDLSSLTKAELVAAAEAAGLDSTGTKATLMERLEAEAEAEAE
jgi:hypothetical protein